MSVSTRKMKFATLDICQSRRRQCRHSFFFFGFVFNNCNKNSYLMQILVIDFAMQFRYAPMPCPYPNQTHVMCWILTLSLEAIAMLLLLMSHHFSIWFSWTCLWLVWMLSCLISLNMCHVLMFILLSWSHVSWQYRWNDLKDIECLDSKEKIRQQSKRVTYLDQNYNWIDSDA